MRGVVLVWLFCGLAPRRNPSSACGVRPVSAQRRGGLRARSLLDVPVNKTSTAFTKPVDRVVGEAIRAWEQERPDQPSARDEKTGEQVHFMFSFRCACFSHGDPNRRLIPAVSEGRRPREDARGRITTHRARSTIATQLFNARQPLTMFERRRGWGTRRHIRRSTTRASPRRSCRVRTPTPTTFNAISAPSTSSSIRMPCAAGCRPESRGASTIWATGTAPTISSINARTGWRAPSAPFIGRRKPLRRSWSRGNRPTAVEVRHSAHCGPGRGGRRRRCRIRQTLDAPRGCADTAGPTPRQLEEHPASEPTQVRRA
jgi:hypothetical protein